MQRKTSAQHPTQNALYIVLRTTDKTAYYDTSLPIGASVTMFAGHFPTHGRKLVVAPSVAHVFPDSTEPTVNSCTTLPHFPSPARDSQLETVHTPLRRF